MKLSQAIEWQNWRRLSTILLRPIHATAPTPPTRPLHAAACHVAKLTDINKFSLQSFLKLAQQERQFAIGPGATVMDAPTGLNLLDDGRPTHAAILLFGSDPQRFIQSAEVACMHFHGTTVVKPILSYKRFKGTLFEQVDSSIDFIMSKLVRAVGTRSQGSTEPVEYEIPGPISEEGQGQFRSQSMLSKLRLLGTHPPIRSAWLLPVKESNGRTHFGLPGMPFIHQQ